MKLKSTHPLHTASLNLCLLGLIAVFSFGCGQQSALNSQLRLSESLQSIKGVKPAELTDTQKDALGSIITMSDSQTLNEFGNPVGDHNWTAKNFRTLVEFLKDVARSAASKNTPESRVGIFALNERAECMYSYSSDPALKGTRDSKGDAQVDYSKSTSQESGEKTIERGQFSFNLDWSIDLQNCRHRDGNAERALINIPMPEYPDYTWDEEQALIEEIYTLQDQRTAIENDLSTTQQSLEANEFDQANLDTESKSYEEDLANLKERNVELTAAVADLEKQKDDLQAKIAAIQAKIDGIEKTYNDAAAEGARINLLIENKLMDLTYKKDGKISGKIISIVKAEADKSKRKSFYDIERPGYEEPDTRFFQSLENIKGSIETQASISGKVSTQGFDETKNIFVPFKIEFSDLTFAVKMNAQDLKELSDLIVTDILPQDERKKGVQDILESSLLCSGSLSFDPKTPIQCSALLQQSLHDFLDEYFDEDEDNKLVPAIRKSKSIGGK